jgi:hypothetical protein
MRLQKALRFGALAVVGLTAVCFYLRGPDIPWLRSVTFGVWIVTLLLFRDGVVGQRSSVAVTAAVGIGIASLIYVLDTCGDSWLSVGIALAVFVAIWLAERIVKTRGHAES